MELSTLLLFLVLELQFQLPLSLLGFVYDGLLLWLLIVGDGWSFLVVLVLLVHSVDEDLVLVLPKQLDERSSSVPEYLALVSDVVVHLRETDFVELNQLVQ